MTAIRGWLEGLGLEQYAEAFEANDIDLALLPKVDDQALKDIGVASTGHRLRIRDAISALTAELAAPDAAPVTRAEAPSAADPPGERRQLTVLFCDMVGYTELASRLDPEVLQGIVRSYKVPAPWAISSAHDGPWIRC